MNAPLLVGSLAQPSRTLVDALFGIAEPLRKFGGMPDPAAVEGLILLIEAYEVFVRPRLDDFKAVSRGIVCGRSVDSAHADFMNRSRAIYESLRCWPLNLDLLGEKTLAATISSQLFGILPQLQHEAARMPTEPIHRLHCEPADRSIWLDNKQLVIAVSPAVLALFTLLTASYPNLITFSEMQKRSTDLAGENQDRLKKSLPSKLARLIKSTPGKGHVLKLPKLPS